MSRMHAEHNDKRIEFHKAYWAAEWSRSPIADGIYPCRETITQHDLVNGVNVYRTDTNNRFYFPWELYEDEQACKNACDLFNDFGYGYDMERTAFLRMSS